jgi:hypothetical protein
MVVGDICALAPNPVVPEPPIAAVDVEFEIWNGSPKPVDGVEDDPDEASD